MTKRILFSLGLFVLVLGLGTGVAKAARPNRPVYPTVAEVQQMIADATAPINTAIASLGQRLTLVETAITGHSSDITSLSNRVSTLESNQPSPQPLPDFNTTLIDTKICQNSNASDLEDQWHVKADLGNTLNGQNFYSTGISNWGILHLPSGDVIGSGNYYNLKWNLITAAQMPPEGSTINADIYTFFSGKLIHMNTDISNWTGFCPISGW